MHYAESIADLVGGTPLVRLHRVTEGISATVLAKVEYLNPGGSAKDRIAAALLDAAEADGRLRPGGTIVEPTSGNTGAGLALEAIRRGYRMLFVVPDKFAGDKVATLRAYGAEVVVTPAAVPADDPRSYYRVAARLAAEIPDAFTPDQFANPAAPRSHFETTGPEIWRDTDGRVTHMVAGIGTGGTISGAGRFLKEASGGRVRVVGADPAGSIYSGGPLHPYLVEGVGEDFWPANYDPAVVDEVQRVDDVESFDLARRLAREEGLLVGGSSGMAVAVALRTARALPSDAVVVVVLPDGGRAYLGTFFDDDWLAAHDLPPTGGVPAAEPAARHLPPPASRLPSRRPDPSRPVPTRTPEESSVTSSSPARPQGFATRAVHAGQEPDAANGDVIPPLHLSTTFVQDGIGGLRGGYEYSRSGNPTRTALQTQLARLEGGAHALSFASGLAAEDVLLRSVLRPGDDVLLGGDVYGGTYRLIARVFGAWGITLRAVDTSDLDAVRAAVASKKPRVVWVETPSNPLLTITDIAAVAAVGHEAGALVVVDNTFASPVLQNPLRLGADVVVHSTTKYLGGHSDVVGGALVLDDDALAEQLTFLQNSAGAPSAPFDAWLTTRGIKTLPLRVAAHSANAQAVAERFAADDRLTAVRYPGLPSHPGHELAARQMHGGFGGIVSIELDTAARARRFAESTRLFALAESLGGVESLVNYPDAMTHASVRGTALAVPDTIVRLSVGIESVEDLIADVDSALEAARHG